jgi:hypothetical protein
MIGTMLALLLGAQAADGPRLTGLPGKHATARTVVLDADVACTPARSYDMWATQAGSRFFAPDSRIDGGVGGRYTVMFYPKEDPEGLVHGTAGAHLLAADPGKFVAFEWVVFAGDDTKGRNAPPFLPDPSMRLPDPLPTWVEIAFTPSGQGTHVAFRHYGFGEGELWGRSHAGFTRAWGGVLEAMKAACAKD